MREIALFVEDYAHQEIIGTLVLRIAEEHNVAVTLKWHSSEGGYVKVVGRLQDYIFDLKQQGSPWPDVIIVATDANCKGLNERRKEVRHDDAPAPMVFAIPDPHVERWLLLDGAAFKAVFGTGCDAPDQKCDRGRYKQQLIESIHTAGTIPLLGGIEYAGDIVREMNIDRASRLDRSFKRFVDDLRDMFQRWKA